MSIELKPECLECQFLKLACQFYTSSDKHWYLKCAVPGHCPGVAKQFTKIKVNSDSSIHSQPKEFTEPHKAKDKLWEFLELGPSKYCAKTHLQVCNLCDRLDCGDNTHPAVLELQRVKKELNQLKLNRRTCTICGSESTSVKTINICELCR
jgi:hypothetical protein